MFWQSKPIRQQKNPPTLFSQRPTAQWNTDQTSSLRHSFEKNINQKEIVYCIKVKWKSIMIWFIHSIIQDKSKRVRRITDKFSKNPESLLQSRKRRDKFIGGLLNWKSDFFQFPFLWFYSKDVLSAASTLTELPSLPCWGRCKAKRFWPFAEVEFRISDAWTHKVLTVLATETTYFYSNCNAICKLASNLNGAISHNILY